MFKGNQRKPSRIERLVDLFDRHLETLEKVGLPMTIGKEFYEMKYKLRERIRRFNTDNDCEIRGLFPVIPIEVMNLDDLMSLLKGEGGSGIVRLPSPAITDKVTVHFRPYIALDPRLCQNTPSSRRRFATTQEIISYAIVNGFIAETDLIAKSSECGGDYLCLTTNENRPELSVTKKSDGEVLSLFKGFIV